MDRNIKAELFSLRNEVLTNIKNIENVVSKIDLKLQEEDHISCLSRCPQIADLLRRCKQIHWHPEESQQEIQKFTDLVNQIDGIMSTIQADKYAEQVAHLIKLSHRIDDIMGPLNIGFTDNEKYWEKKTPGITTALQFDGVPENLKVTELPLDDIQEAKQLLEQKLSNNHDQEVTVSPFTVPNVYPDLPNKDTVNYITDQLLDIDPIENNTSIDDLSLAPAWAQNVDTKSINQIIEDARVWDDINQQIFVNTWNSTFTKRLDVLKECLEVIALDINNTKPPKNLNVTSLEDAQKALELFQKFDEIKHKMVTNLRQFCNDCKSEINAVNDEEKFVKYYEYLTNFVTSMSNEQFWLPNEVDSPLNDLIRRFTHLVNAAIQDHEMDIYEPPITINEKSFEINKISQDQLSAYKSYCYFNYTTDLKNAYEYISKKSKSSVSST